VLILGFFLCEGEFNCSFVAVNAAPLLVPVPRAIGCIEAAPILLLDCSDCKFLANTPKLLIFVCFALYSSTTAFFNIFDFPFANLPKFVHATSCITCFIESSNVCLDIWAAFTFS
jgi:hypothetical protein